MLINPVKIQYVQMLRGCLSGEWQIAAHLYIPSFCSSITNVSEQLSFIAHTAFHLHGLLVSVFGPLFSV